MKFTQYHRARAKDPKYSRQFKKPRMPTYWLPTSNFVTAMTMNLAQHYQKSVV